MTCKHARLIIGDKLGCKLEDDLECSGNKELGCPDYVELTKQASKEAEKPVLTLTKRQIRKMFKKLRKQSLFTCSWGREAELAVIAVIERTLMEKGGFV